MTSHRIHAALFLGLGSLAGLGGCGADLDVGDKPQNIEPSTGEDMMPAESTGDSEDPGMTSVATTDDTGSTGEPTPGVSPPCEHSTPGAGADTAIAWGVICGGGASQSVRFTAIEDDGSIYTLTQVEGTGGETILFGEDAFETDDANPVLLLSKLDPDGNFEWNRGFATDDNWWAASSLAVCDGRVYFTASRGYGGSAEIDFGTGNVDGNLAIVAVDGDGQTLWAQATGQNDDDSSGYPTGTVSCRDGGGIHVFGSATGAAEIGGIALGSGAGSYVVAVDDAGVGDWGVFQEGIGLLTAAPTPSGGVVTYGFGPQVAPSGGSLALTSFDAAGAQQWQHVFEATGVVTPAGVLVGDDGAVTIAGGWAGEIDLGQGPVVGVDPLVDPFDPELPPQYMDAFVARYDASGGVDWVTLFAEAGGDYTSMVRLDADGDADIVYTDAVAQGSLLSLDGTTTETLTPLISEQFTTAIAGNAASGFVLGYGDVTGLDVFDPALTPRQPFDYVVVRVSP